MTQASFELSIDGMHCGGCVRRVTKALENLPGVKDVKVEIGRAEGALEEGGPSMEELCLTVAQLGFKAQPV